MIANTLLFPGLLPYPRLRKPFLPGILLTAHRRLFRFINFLLLNGENEYFYNSIIKPQPYYNHDSCFQ